MNKNKLNRSYKKLKKYIATVIVVTTVTTGSGLFGNNLCYAQTKSPDTVYANEALAVTAKASTAVNAVGDKLTINATGAGGSGNYTYKFIVHNTATDQWAKLADFGTSNTVTWTAGSAGNREFFVDIKDTASGTVVRSQAMKLTTTKVLSITATVSATTNLVGNKLTISATGVGGSGNYTYKFLVYNTDTRQWAKLADFSASNTFTWTAGSAGNREFYVDVKDSTGKVERCTVMKVNTNNVSPLVVTAKASATSNQVGDNLTIDATGSGGYGTYTYKFLVYNTATKEWTKLKDFSSTNTYSWAAEGTAYREFYVDIKDTVSGKVVRSAVMGVTTTVPGWNTINGKSYYYVDGNKLTGWQDIGEFKYFFNESGVKSSKVGIDVSKFQGTIDWNAVKAQGVEFAIIRIGVRGWGSGTLVRDTNFQKNLEGAIAAGMQVGVYIFSEAITTDEGREEANYILNAIKGYNVTGPIVFDTEDVDTGSDPDIPRARDLSVELRTSIAAAFCKTVIDAGYTPMVYSNKDFLLTKLDMSKLTDYKTWVAHYKVNTTDYPYSYKIWQYTKTGTVNGISGDVDLDIWLD